MYAYLSRVKPKIRLSSEERRENIIATARRVFSEKGFHGTTTRELAREAAVSEALLFKHFPNKEAIYAAMLSGCQKTQVGSEARRVLELEPSTSTLAIMLHFLLSKIILGNADARAIHRLVLRSLCEDGEFARVILKHVGSSWVPKMRQCLEMAKKDGDLRESADNLISGSWLTQHLLLMISFLHIPEHPVVAYKISDNKLTEESVVFCLRGLGLNDGAIEKFYNPRAFALFTSD